MNNELIRILLIEDNPGDADLLKVLLEDIDDADIELVHVERLQKGIELLKAGNVDVILLDLSLPDAQGQDTIARAHAAALDIPIVVLTGQDDQEVAINALRNGVQDYLIKSPISGRGLIRAMRHAIERKRLENDKARLILELKEALANIKTLSSLLPICAGCKKIRDDKGYWNQVEAYLSSHLGVGFSHGMCPACMEEWYGDYSKEIETQHVSPEASEAE